MIAYLFDIASLLGRWLHLITGIAWIGASFYFVWLDDSLLPPKRRELVDAGVGGEVWAVHGGGFYNAQKYKVAPVELPEPLHWFYWEAYATWLSGFFLLCLLYFGQAEVYLIDASVAALSKPAAIAIALSILAGAWLIYDLLCRLTLGDNERALASAIAALCAAAAIGLCALFSGRGAYILFGAMLGTIMVANVFFVIIPGQREMVRAKAEGRVPDPLHSQRGKQRSVHNTYFTLPVLFTMISNHYALTFGSTHNAIVLIALSLAGASIRAWFVARHKAHERDGKTSPWTLAVGLLLIAGVVAALAPARPGNSVAAAPADHASVEARFSAIRSIVEQRCVPCHSPTPTLAGFNAAPNGVLLDTPERLLARTAQIQTQLSTGVMPIGNLTHMTDAERQQVITWLIDGAPH
jgi:uncharacterized membrane protein